MDLFKVADNVDSFITLLTKLVDMLRFSIKEVDKFDSLILISLIEVPINEVVKSLFIVSVVRIKVVSIFFSSMQISLS